MGKVKTSLKSQSLLQADSPNFENSELANLDQIERTCSNAQTAIDPESIEHFCRTWAEVGQAILARRNKSDDKH
jgi:hypothetical protein